MRRKIQRKCCILITNPILLRPVVTLQDAEANLSSPAHVVCGKEAIGLSCHGQFVCKDHGDLLVARGLKVTKL